MVIPGGLQRLEDISQARLIMSQMLNPPIDVSSAYSKWTRVKLADLAGQAFKQSGMAARISHRSWGSNVLGSVHSVSLLITEQVR